MLDVLSDDEVPSTSYRRKLVEIDTIYSGPRLESWKDHVRVMAMHWNLIGVPDDDDEARCKSLVLSMKGEARKIAFPYIKTLFTTAVPSTPLIYKDVVATLDELFLPKEAHYKNLFLNFKQGPNVGVLLYINYKCAIWKCKDEKLLIAEIIKGLSNPQLKSLLSMKEFGSVNALMGQVLVYEAILRSRVCYRCGTPGHERANCPQGRNLQVRHK